MSRRSGIGAVLRTRGPAVVLGVAGVALLGAGLAVPAFGTLLVAWGGTALFGAGLLVLLGETSTVRAEVATDVYAVLADNCRETAGTDRMVYAPGDQGVELVGTDTVLKPTGLPLADRIEAASVTEASMTSGHLQVLVDGLIAELELVEDATGETGDGEARVRASGCRIGTDELFDHPVASVVGVGLARSVDGPVRVEAEVEDDALVVTCRWGDVAEQRGQAPPDAVETAPGAGPVAPDV